MRDARRKAAEASYIRRPAEPEPPAAPAAAAANKYVSIFGNNTNQNSDNFTDEEVINDINQNIETIGDLLSKLQN